MTNTSTYNKTYWEENRERLLTARKNRYKKDKAYKKAINARSQIDADELAEKRRVIRLKKKKNERKVGISSKRRYVGPIVVGKGSASKMLFSSSYCADSIGISSELLIYYERLKVLPQPTSIEDNGRKWYSREHMAFVKRMLDKYSGYEWKLDYMKKNVDIEWKKLLAKKNGR